MRGITGLRELDTRAWATATWATPFVIQIVLAVTFTILWLSGKLSRFQTHGAESNERAWFLSAAAATGLLAVLVIGLLGRSQSSRVRGLAVSITGSSAIVVSLLVVYALAILRW